MTADSAAQDHAETVAASTPSETAIAPGAAAGERDPGVPFAWLAAIVALTWLVYAPSLSGGFIWDDNSYVLYNKLLRDGAGLWRIWFDPSATPQYHPFVFTSFWLEWQLWGESTLGYHIVNLALHSANCVLLWAILRSLRVPGALFAAALFALVPVHVESVAWISERKDVLSGFFYGLTVLAWIRFLRDGRERDWAIALALAACTLLSKTVLCTLPAGLALIAWWQAPERWRSWSMRLLPFALLALPIAAVTAWREHAHGNPDLPFSALERILIAGRALWEHVRLLFWPVGLTIVYAYWPLSTADPTAYLFPLAWLAVLATLWALCRRLGVGPLVGIAFFTVTLAPMLGLVDYNIMRYAFLADHFQYVASAGPIAVVAAGAAVAMRSAAPALRLALAAIALAPLALLSWQQAGLYADANTMWSDNVAKNPRSWTGHNFLATELMRAGRYDEALALLEKALLSIPDNANAHQTIGVVLVSVGRQDEGMTHLLRAVELDPDNPVARNSLGAVLLGSGRVDEAHSHFKAALQTKPDYAEAWRNLAIAESRLGNRQAVIAALREVARLRPDDPQARADLDGAVAREE